MKSEVGKAISTGIMFLVAIVVLGHLFNTDALYEQYPVIKELGWVIGGGILIYWAVTTAPEAARYLGKQFARGMREAKEEKNDES